MEQQDQQIDTRDTVSPGSAAPQSPSLELVSDSSSLKLPTIPESLYVAILSQLPVGDPQSITTLLRASLVSHAFHAAASSPFVWQPHSDFRWRRSDPAAWVQLPSTCDPGDQRFLDQLFGRSGTETDAVLRGGRGAWTSPDPARGREEYRVRVMVDRLGGEHLQQLVWSQGDKLKSFDLLCALGDQFRDGVFARPQRWVQDAFEGHYWMGELTASIERRKAAKYWRQFDSGELCQDDRPSMREWGAAGFTAFTGHPIHEGYAVHRWATNLVQPSVLRQLPNPWLDLVDLSIDEPEYLVQIKLVLSAESLFKAVLAELFQRQFSPAHPLSSEAKNLDSCFLNLVQEQATDHDQRLRRIGILHDDLLDRGAWPQEIEQALFPSVRRLKPTTNLTSFTHLVAAVFRRLPHSHRLHLDPTLEPHLLRGLMMKIWRDEGEGDDSAEAKRIVWAEVIFDVLSGEVYLKPDGKERRFTALTPFDSIRRIASDLCTSLAAQPPLPSSHRVSRQSARYAQLLVPSVISQPYEGPEAVLRLSAAAVKLAEHVGRHFPFDVSLLETLVLPLVWGTQAREKIECVIERVKLESQTIRVKRRTAEGGDDQPARVGTICSVIELEGSLGVVLGWDEKYEASSAERANLLEKVLLPDNLELGKDQPFYLVMHAEPFHSLDSPISYYAAEELDLDITLHDQDITYLIQVPELGRWFREVQTVQLDGDGEFSFRMMPSAELQAMYPDD